MNGRPEIPRSVKLAVRRRCGFACVDTQGGTNATLKALLRGARKRSRT